MNGLFLAMLLAAPETGDLSALRHLKEVAWPRAYREADPDQLAAILHEDFQLITSDGQWITRDEELDLVARYEWPHDHFEYEIRRLDAYGDTAIVAGEGRAQGTDKDGPYCLRYQSSNVLVRAEGRWEAVSSHVSGVETGCEKADAPTR